MRKYVLIIILGAFHKVLLSQSGSVHGRITDKQTNEPLAGATIAIKGFSTSGITNSGGFYTLKNVNAGQINLIISYIGYENLELSVLVHEGRISNRDAALNLVDRIGNAVVVSASKRDEKITNAPASIRVIGKKELDEFAGSNVFELATYLQGVEFGRSGIDYVSLNARGFNRAANNKLLQIVDSRNTMTTASTYLPMYNYSTINKLDVDRIEMVFGPQSALFGPNAHSAVFNTITKDPGKYQGTTVAVSAGNHYQFSTRLRHAVKIDSKWAYKLTGEYLAGREFIFYDSVYAGNQTGLTPQFGPPVAIPERNVNFDFRRIRGEAHLYYSLAPEADIIISTGASHNTSLGVSNIGRNQARGISPSFLQARFVHPNFFVTVYNTWGKLGTSYGIYPYTRDFWNRTHTNPPMSPDSAEMFVMQSNRGYEKNQRLNAEAQYNYFFQKTGVHLVAGLSYQKEKPNSYGTTLVDKDKRIYVTQWGGVAQLEKTFAWGMRFIGAARLDNHSNFGNLFSPKLALIKNINDHNFRITWAKAYAVPGIFFQYGSGPVTFGNGPGVKYIPNGSKDSEESIISTISLKPEEIETWEIGYKGTVAKRLYIDFNSYYGISKNFQSPPLPQDGKAVSVGDIPVIPANPGFVDGNGIVRGAGFSTYFNYGSVSGYGLDIGLNYSFSKIIRLAV
ncbi:MAG TPA: TonB-dependent receptor, partial [Chitinophagaceae bacterium]|nr:TonB-dependent receptor [Chitinophagaceae bacterium]